jgi:hypothetical protein
MQTSAKDVPYNTITLFLLTLNHPANWYIRNTRKTTDRAYTHEEIN